MAAAKDGQQLIDDFKLLTDEQDDMSDAQILALAQEVIDIINNDRDWKYLVKTKNGTLTSSDLTYTLPTDFRNLTENWEDFEGIQHRILYVGTEFDRYPFIDMVQRMTVRDARGYAFIDILNDNLVLTALEDGSRIYEFDYIHNPIDITISTAPIFSAQFHKAVPKLMAVLWADIDQTDKSFSYALENNREYRDLIDTMALQDGQSNNQTIL